MRVLAMRMPFVDFRLCCLLVGMFCFPANLFSQPAKETRADARPAAASGSLEQALDQAKLEYQTKAAENTKKLLGVLDQRIAAARGAGDKETLQRLQAEKEIFEADGTLPASLEKSSQNYLRQLQTLRAKLKLTYRNQIKEYVKRFEDDKAEALEQELDQFLSRESRGSGDAGAKASELIRNGGCEDDLAVGKDVPWVVTAGKFERLTTSPGPHAGKAFFWSGFSELSEIVQEVDVQAQAAAIDAGQRTAVFSGYVRTLPQPGKADTSQIILEFLNAGKTKPLATFDSGEIANPEAWQQVTDSRVAPKGTRWIRVRLRGDKGRGEENNAYFDTISLHLDPVRNPPQDRK